MPPYCYYIGNLIPKEHPGYISHLRTPHCSCMEFGLSLIGYSLGEFWEFALKNRFRLFFAMLENDFGRIARYGPRFPLNCPIEQIRPTFPDLLKKDKQWQLYFGRFGFQQFVCWNEIRADPKKISQVSIISIYNIYLSIYLFTLFICNYIYIYMLSYVTDYNQILYIYI